MTATTIRPATPADVPGIARIHVDSWRSTYQDLIANEFLASRSYESRAQYWARNLADPPPASFLYVAETEAREIVGFVSAGPGRDGDGGVYLCEKLAEIGGQTLSEVAYGWKDISSFVRRNHVSTIQQPD